MLLDMTIFSKNMVGRSVYIEIMTNFCKFSSFDGLEVEFIRIKNLFMQLHMYSFYSFFSFNFLPTK